MCRANQPNAKEASVWLLNACDNYIIRYRKELPKDVINLINELSVPLERFSKHGT